MRVTYIDPYPGAVAYVSDSTGDDGRQNIGLPVGGKIRVDIAPIGGHGGQSAILECTSESEVKF